MTRTAWVTVLLALQAAACTSPEAIRRRGGAGADVGNRTPTVEIHAGAQPFYQTRCATEPVECNGPPAVFGRTRPPK